MWSQILGKMAVLVYEISFEKSDKVKTHKSKKHFVSKPFLGHIRLFRHKYETLISKQFLPNLFFCCFLF